MCSLSAPSCSGKMGKAQCVARWLPASIPRRQEPTPAGNPGMKFNAKPRAPSSYSEDKEEDPGSVETAEAIFYILLLWETEQSGIPIYSRMFLGNKCSVYTLLLKMPGLLPHAASAFPFILRGWDYLRFFWKPGQSRGSHLLRVWPHPASPSLSLPRSETETKRGAMSLLHGPGKPIHSAEAGPSAGNRLLALSLPLRHSRKISCSHCSGIFGIIPSWPGDSNEQGLREKHSGSHSCYSLMAYL